jgi:hypothetical protein
VSLPEELHPTRGVWLLAMPQTWLQTLPSVFPQILILLILWISTPSALASETSTDQNPCTFDPDLLQLVDRCIASSIRHKWQQAHAPLDSLLQIDPENPLPLLFKSSLYAFQMTEEESFRLEPIFLDDLNLVFQRLPHFRQSQIYSTHQLDFIEGTALAWKAYHAGRHEKWLDALRYGLRGAEFLEDLYERCPDFADLKLAIGTFRFWKSARFARLGWMPFFRDNRTDALPLVEEAYAHGHFNRWVAASNLCWMYLDLEWAQKAKDLALEGLNEFPDSQLFLFPLAEADLVLGRYSDANGHFEKLLVEVCDDPAENNVNAFILLEKQSQCALGLEQIDEMHNLGNRALTLPISDENKKRLHERVARLKKRLRQHPTR